MEHEISNSFQPCEMSAILAYILSVLSCFGLFMWLQGHVQCKLSLPHHCALCQVDAVPEWSIWVGKKIQND